MTIKIGPKRFRVRFQRTTTCRIEEMSSKGHNLVAEASTKCHHDDENSSGRKGLVYPDFDVQAGEKEALKRALSVMASNMSDVNGNSVNREERRQVNSQFWLKFLYRWGIVERPKAEQMRRQKTKTQILYERLSPLERMIFDKMVQVFESACEDSVELRQRIAVGSAAGSEKAE